MLKCPACNERCDGEATRIFSAAEAAQHFVLAEGYPERNQRLQLKIRQLWQGDDCKILSCSSCSLKFAWPFVAGDGDFYNLAYPYSSYPETRWEFEETLKELARINLGQSKVLEIGSGFGHFLSRLSPKFVAPSQVVAIEYNDVARARLSAAGFTPFAEDIREPRLDIYKGQIAVFFMFQVLEHMDRIEMLFQRLKELARPGANVFLAVPNPARIRFNENHDSLCDMPPNHISTWAESSFAAIARRFQMDIVSYRVQNMALLAVWKQDLIYSHMQRAQIKGSLANWIRSRPRTRVRIAFEGALACISAPRRWSAWRDAANSKASLGDSCWVHLRFR